MKKTLITSLAAAAAVALCGTVAFRATAMG